MSFGKSSGNRDFGPNAKLYYFKLKTKDLPEPLWEVKQKEGDDLVVVDAAAKFVDGDIIDIQNKEFQHGKKVIKSVTVTFHDTAAGKNDVYFVTVPHTYLGRNILNSLLGLKTYGGVQIGLYTSKPKPDPKDPTKMRPGFHSAAVRQGGQLVYGKFKFEELPVIPKIKVGADIFGDDTDITAFFTTHMEEMRKAVRASLTANVPAGAGADGVDTGAEHIDTGAPEDEPEGTAPVAPLPF